MGAEDASTTITDNGMISQQYHCRSVSPSSSDGGGGRRRHESSANNNNNSRHIRSSLYSQSSRRELRSARRSKGVKRRGTAEDLLLCIRKDPPKRSFSADSHLLRKVLDDNDVHETKKLAEADVVVTLGIQRHGTVKLELRMNDSNDDEDNKPLLFAAGRTKSKQTLDELLCSNHVRRRRRRRRKCRQRLTVKGTRDPWALRKSLSYWQMQELTASFRYDDILELKESLHGVQQQRKKQQQQQQNGELLAAAATEMGYHNDNYDRSDYDKLVDKLATMFEKALQQQHRSMMDDNDLSEHTMLPQQVRPLILNLTIEKMVEVVQHLDSHSQQPQNIEWTLLQSVIDPHRETGLDWEDQLQSSSNARHSLKEECNANDDDEYSYETWVSSSASSSSYLMSEDGNDCGFDFKGYNDDDDNMSGISLEADTEHCDSSITLEDFQSLCETSDHYLNDSSFAIADGGILMVEVADDFDSSLHEVVEDSFVLGGEEEEEVVYEEEIVVEEHEPVMIERRHEASALQVENRGTLGDTKLLAEERGENPRGQGCGGKATDQGQMNTMEGKPTIQGELSTVAALIEMFERRCQPNKASTTTPSA